MALALGSASTAWPLISTEPRIPIIQLGAARFGRRYRFFQPDAAPLIALDLWSALVQDDNEEFNRAIQALLDRYPKDRILAALRETPLRPGPKRKDDTQTLIRMGRIMTWHRDLSERRAAEIVTRHLSNDRRSIIDRIRKGFAKDRDYYLRAGKVNEIINLITAAERTTKPSGKNRERGDDEEPLITVVLPDDGALEAMFQELRAKLRAVCVLSNKDPVVLIPKLGEIRSE